MGSGFTRALRKIDFALFPCASPTIVDENTITCQALSIAGTWQPKVYDEYGLIPVNTDATIHISLEVASVAPQHNLNPFGGTDLKISATNLPPSISKETTVSVVFEDGTLCDVIKITKTAIDCVTQRFNSTESDGLGVTITLNGEVDQSLTITVQPTPVRVTEIQPSSASPVLKAILTIVVANFSHTLVPSDLSVKLVSQNDTSIVRYGNVVEAGPLSDGTQYLKIKFGGSESGVYDVFVRSLSYGNFDSTGVTLKLIGAVTDFNPK